ncbi:MAG: hypothetical protein WCC21_06925 [Candidatus Acidiferrales bacterium]
MASRANAVAQRTVVPAGIFDTRIRILRYSLDKMIFRILASGSTLLTIAFSSHSLASVARKFSRASVPAEGQTEFRNAL